MKAICSCGRLARAADNFHAPTCSSGGGTVAGSAAGLDDLLLGLAAHDGAQVRLFNPFAAARGSPLGRWMQRAGDFKRLNHRMHNKLFIADGAMAIVGGRNLADGYFQRDAGAHFIDFGLLAVGAVLPDLAAAFDRYWNSAQVRDVTTLATPDAPAPVLRARFESATRATDEPQASLAYERYRVPLLQMRVKLYEVSAVQVQRDESTRHAFGASRAQLHAKLAPIDRRAVLLGSMNLDQRSATTNTDMLLLVRSPGLVQDTLRWFNSKERADVRGSYQVRLKPDGRSLQWVALLGEGRSETLDSDPEFNPWERLRLWLISLWVPESLL